MRHFLFFPTWPNGSAPDKPSEEPGSWLWLPSTKAFREGQAKGRHLHCTALCEPKHYPITAPRAKQALLTGNGSRPSGAPVA
jgi:hypothetical protein